MPDNKDVYSNILAGIFNPCGAKKNPCTLLLASYWAMCGHKYVVARVIVKIKN